MQNRRFWKWYHSGGVLALLIFVCTINWFVGGVRTSWLLTLCSLIVFTMVVSDGITGCFWWGWLVNEQYRVSLSRLQMSLWTVVILSCFTVAVSINIKHGLGIDALGVAIQAELWTAMGISTASLVGSPLILSGKKRKSRSTRRGDLPQETKKIDEDRDETIAERIRTVFAERPGALVNREGGTRESKDLVANRFDGVVYRNENPAEASLAELFTGEEVSNFDVVDLTRLQAFFFTVVLVLTYAFNAVSYLAKADTVTELPSLGASGLSLLAISTGVYLTGKAIPKG